MKFFTILLAISILCQTWALAKPRSIHVEWGYVEWGYTEPSDPAVTGFRLYQEGVAVHDWAWSDVRAGDAEVDITAPITIFTLTATFNDNTESPHSAPFALNPMAPETIKFVWLKHGNKAVPMIKPQGVRLR